MSIVKTKIDSIYFVKSNFLKIILKPISRGYSGCFAPMIRCMLFNSVYGFAITEIKIEGVKTEYDSIPGVKESVLELIFNLKTIIFNLKKDKKIILNLKKIGPSEVKAKDIILPEGVKIINPEILIANLSSNFVLDITIKVEEGKGYVPFNTQKYDKKELDGILLDANFSPINKVFYKVKNISDDLYDDLDKIEFFIETNGSVNPKKALLNSIGFFLYQLSDFKIKNKEKVLKKEVKSYYNLDENLFIEISEVEVTLKTLNILRKLKIIYLGDLISYSEKELLSIKGLGKKILGEIKRVLSNFSLSLGTTIDNWKNILNDFIKDNNNFNTF